MAHKNIRKVALIIGATSGIGKATAFGFAKEGYRVALAARREAEGNQIIKAIQAEGGEGLFIQTDVTDEAQIQRLVGKTMQAYGRLDTAFNNAGTEGTMGQPLADLKAQDYREMFDVNVGGVFYGMKYQIPAMLQSGGGSIINTASIFSQIGMAGMSLYTAAKHAVVGLTKAAALEYAKQGIRINAISPGGVETEMFVRAAGPIEENSEGRQYFTNFHPMGRISQPEEQAAVVQFLASDKASFVNGDNYSVDSGWSIS